MIYFFLSYARGDEDELVQRFFQDLSTDVRLLAGLPAGEVVGFIDQTIQVGERWSRQLAEALASCGSFLALMTPRYFQSQMCGREWAAFAERAARYEAQARVDSSLLKPVMWVPTPQPKRHAVADSLQYFSGDLGETYHRLGIRQLMRLRRHQDDYRSFTFGLAEKIVESVETHRLDRGPLPHDMSAMASAFHLPRAGATGDSGRDGAENPFLVHFIVAALDRDRMSGIRRHVNVYGDYPLAWAPYRPPMPEPISDYAGSIASRHGFQFRVAEVTELAACAELAQRHNQILVLLVDAWVTREDATRDLLSAHTASLAGKPVITGALLPISREDPETSQNWSSLSVVCRGVFGRLVDDEMYRSPLTSHAAFELALPEVLETARNRLYSVGEVKRSLDPSVDTSPTRLDGPWAVPAPGEFNDDDRNGPIPGEPDGGLWADPIQEEPDDDGQ